MLSDRLIVLHTYVQSRFHAFLMICKRGVGFLPLSFCCLELRMCQTFDNVIKALADNQVSYDLETNILDFLSM